MQKSGKNKKKGFPKALRPGNPFGNQLNCAAVLYYVRDLQLLHKGTDEVNTSFTAKRGAVEDEIIAFGASPFFVREEIVVKASVLIHLFDERFRFFC